MYPQEKNQSIGPEGSELPKILIIDDDKTWLERLSESLSSSGYSIYVAENRSRAVKLLNNENFNLVTLNIKLSSHEKKSKIILRWTELLELIHKKVANIIVVTSPKEYPPPIEQDRLMTIAFADYKVLDFFLKEEFDENQYRQTVAEALGK